MKVAVASCQQYEHGYFSAYQHMLRDDPDLIVHTGDYIYEHSWGETRVRHHRQQKIAVTLDEFRLQYSLYKSDPDLMAAHAAVPWLVTWDDHEVLNDYGADVGEGLGPEAMRARRLAAYRAYYEHMPLPKMARPNGDAMRIYMSRSFGDLASFYMLDERQYRSPPACRKADGTYIKRLDNCAELNDPARTMLGAQQEAWLGKELASTRARWNLLAQGVVMSYIDEDPGPDTRFWADGWNGNPTGRERLMTQLADHRVPNPIVLSGDVHAFIVSGLHRHPGDLESPIVGTELVATSVTSQGTPQRVLDPWKAANPNLLIAEGRSRGYLRLEITDKTLTADLVALDSALKPQSQARTLQRFVVEAGKPGPVAA
jgi:alkaline phosphatase D